MPYPLHHRATVLTLFSARCYRDCARNLVVASIWLWVGLGRGYKFFFRDGWVASVGLGWVKENGPTFNSVVALFWPTVTVASGPFFCGTEYNDGWSVYR